VLPKLVGPCAGDRDRVTLAALQDSGRSRRSSDGSATSPSVGQDGRMRRLRWGGREQARPSRFFFFFFFFVSSNPERSTLFTSSYGVDDADFSGVDTNGGSSADADAGAAGVAAVAAVARRFDGVGTNIL